MAEDFLYCNFTELKLLSSEALPLKVKVLFTSITLSVVEEVLVSRASVTAFIVADGYVLYPLYGDDIRYLKHKKPKN